MPYPLLSIQNSYFNIEIEIENSKQQIKFDKSNTHAEWLRFDKVTAMGIYSYYQHILVSLLQQKQQQQQLQQ